MLRPYDEIGYTIDTTLYEIRIYQYAPYIPAQVTGLPEDCYPAEGGVAEYEIYLDGEVAEDPDTGLSLKDSLTNEEQDSLEQAIFRHYEDHQ